MPNISKSSGSTCSSFSFRNPFSDFTPDVLLFDWEKKIIERIKYFGGAELYLKNDKEIYGLFKGYPDFFTENFLERYTDEKYN